MRTNRTGETQERGSEMTDQRPSILIVDDESTVRDSLRAWFQKDGFDAESAVDGEDGLKKLTERPRDVALIDIKMPTISGMEVLHRIRRIDPDAACIMITAYASVDTAVEALKAGAIDYVVKPVDPEELSRVVSRALETRKRAKENRSLCTLVDVPDEDLVGRSDEIERVRELIGSVAQTDVSVLIRGEIGTCKGLIARLIHAGSPRHANPLVPVNCGALPGSQLESELFGHENESSTDTSARGSLESANSGTLFLDEVGAIDAPTQVNLLRVLEAKQLTPAGGGQVVPLDLRVVAATNQDLQPAVNDGRFREDFYYYIGVFPIDVPPLRERPGDILVAARHLMGKFAQQMNKKVIDISPKATDLLVAHPWPGNVRELKNAIERAVVLTKGPELLPEDLPVHIAGGNPPADGDALGQIERAHIKYILQRENWNISRAARILGIDRVTLYNRIKKYGLSR